jgi:hypothetical protein
MALPYYMVRLSIVTLSIIQIIDFEDFNQQGLPYERMHVCHNRRMLCCRKNYINQYF